MFQHNQFLKSQYCHADINKIGNTFLECIYQLRTT